MLRYGNLVMSRVDLGCMSGLGRDREGGYGLHRREGRVVVQVQKREGREGLRVA